MYFTLCSSLCCIIISQQKNFEDKEFQSLGAGFNKMILHNAWYVHLVSSLCLLKLDAIFWMNRLLQHGQTIANEHYDWCKHRNNQCYYNHLTLENSIKSTKMGTILSWCPQGPVLPQNTLWGRFLLHCPVSQPIFSYWVD